MELYRLEPDMEYWLGQIFLAYANFGSGASVTKKRIDNVLFAKLCRELGICDPTTGLPPGAIDVTFAAVKPPGQRTLDFHSFLSALQSLASQLWCDLDAVEAFNMLIVTMVNAHLSYLTQGPKPPAARSASAPRGAARAGPAAFQSKGARRSYSTYTSRHPGQAPAVPSRAPQVAHKSSVLESTSAAKFANDPHIPRGHLTSETLRTIFKYYSAFGQRGNTELMLDQAKFAKMCRELRLIDDVLTATDVDLIFVRVRPPGERRLTYRGFCAALCLVAEAKYPMYHPDVANQLLLQDVAGTLEYALAKVTAREGQRDVPYAPTVRPAPRREIWE